MDFASGDGHRKLSPMHCAGRSSTVAYTDLDVVDTARPISLGPPTTGFTSAYWHCARPLSLRGGHKVQCSQSLTEVTDVTWPDGHTLDPWLPSTRCFGSS